MTTPFQDDHCILFGISLSMTSAVGLLGPEHSAQNVSHNEWEGYNFVALADCFSYSKL
jgi:hypothetical protein